MLGSRSLQSITIVLVVVLAVSLGPSTIVGGDLTYAGGSVETDPDATIEGSVTQVEPVEPFEPPGAAAAFLGFIYSLIANLVFGALLLFLLPEFSRTTTIRAIDEAPRSGGMGLLVLFAVPVLLVILLITIVGIPIALLGGVLYALLIWAGYLYGAIAVGTWLLDRAGSTAGRWASLLLGVVLVAVLSAVPLIGWLIGLIVMLVGLGALSLGLVRGFRERRSRRVEGWPRDDAGRIGARRDAEETGPPPVAGTDPVPDVDRTGTDAPEPVERGPSDRLDTDRTNAEQLDADRHPDDSDRSERRDES